MRRHCFCRAVSPFVAAAAVFLVLVLQADSLRAGAWTLGRKRVWAKLSYYTYSAERRFAGADCFGCQPGDRIPYNFNGEAGSTAIFLDLWWGLSHRLDLQVQGSYYPSVSFNDDVDDRDSDGIGDFRFGAKFLLLESPVVTSVKVVAKAPLGDFPIDAELVPVGEGQWDIDFLAQFGRSLWPLPGYANLGIGYRLRARNRETDIKPGNEWLIQAEFGYGLRRWLMLKGRLDITYGARNEFAQLKIRGSERRITYLSPSVLLFPETNTTIEAGFLYPLAGRNFPAGTVFTIGVSRTFDLDTPFP